MANVVRTKLQQAEAAPLFAPLSLPDGTIAIDAVWAGAGGGDALGPWIDRLLSAALRTGDTGVAHLEGSRDAVRYVLEIAGDLVAASNDGAVALPGRRAAVGLTVSLDGAHTLADSWASGLRLGLLAPAENPVVALLRRPGGDVLLASTPALPPAARTLIDQLPEAPRPPAPPLPLEAAVTAEGRPSGLRVIVALVALSLAAIGIAALHAVTGGSPQPATVSAVTAPSVVALQPPSPPSLASSPPVANGVIAADPATGNLVLVGCCDGTGVSGPTVSTWSWDGRSWTHVAARTSAPPFQRGLHLVYDDGVGAFVLQGGLAQSGTWTWAAGTWAEAQPGLQPPLGATSMVYDPAMKRVVLIVPDPGDQLAQTWAWDGHLWTELDSGGPTLNNPTALAYDPATQQLVLAGQDNPSGTEVTVWTFTALRTWRHDALVAGFTYDPTMELSWDGVSRRLIAVSLGPDAIPANGATLPVDSWAWDGRVWSQLPTAGAPTEQGLLVSSADHHVLFVGVDETAAGPDVWAWTGTNWTTLRPPRPAGDGLGGFTPATTAAPPAAVP